MCCGQWRVDCCGWQAVDYGGRWVKQLVGRCKRLGCGEGFWSITVGDLICGGLG